MNFDTFAFFFFAVAVIALLRLVRSGPIRDCIFLVANLAFATSFASSAMEMVPLFAFAALGYVAVVAAAGLNLRSAICILIVGIVGMFIWLKQYTILASMPTLHFAYLTVGMSYILFRILHLVIDLAQGASPLPSPVSYFNYTFSLFTFLSGPIQRYQEFHHQTSKTEVPSSPSAIDRLVGRILLGYFLLVVIVPLLQSQSTSLQTWFYGNVERHDWARATLGFGAASFAYLVYLYANFSAYMHIVIGMGAMAGFALPENFNAPFSASNMLDFWSRWHITLSMWFKTYVFNPLLKVLAAYWSGTNSLNYLGAIVFFVTFGLMGIWHGSTTIFLVYGALLGASVTLNKIWQSAARNWLGKTEYSALRRRAWYAHGCRAATLAYFAVALSCLWLNNTKVSAFEVLACGSGAFLLLTIALSAAVALEQPTRSVWQTAVAPGLLRLRTKLVGDLQQLSASYLTASKVAALVILAVANHGSAPELVYKGF